MPTKAQVDTVKLKYMKQKFAKQDVAAAAKKKKAALDATKKKSDSTSGGMMKAIKRIGSKSKARHKMLRDI